MQIYKFNSILKPVLWGGDKIVSFKHLPATDKPIGESWELSALPGYESVVTVEGEDSGQTLTQLIKHYGADLVGEDVYHRYGNCFPLLIKVIDARLDLSVQVHPDDEMATRRHGSKGKNEMWYILHTDAGAMIRAGFNRALTIEDYDRRLADGTLMEVINVTPSHQGDVFYIPAGQIHTIGGGNLLVEIQQSSDITYRVWDYNRRDADGNLRQLHVQESREALNLAAHDCRMSDFPGIGEGMKRLVKCRDFEVNRLDLVERRTMEWQCPHSFVALFCARGDADLHVEGMPRQSIHQGEVSLIPAIADKVEMTGSETLLLITVPPEN